MSDFMSGLKELLGGWNAVRRIDKEGFDWREQAAQQEAARQQQQQGWQQANEDWATKAATEAAQGAEGEDISGLIPDQVNKARVLARVRGAGLETKSQLEERRKERELALQTLRNQGGLGLVEKKAELAAPVREDVQAHQSELLKSRLEALEKQGGLNREMALTLAHLRQSGREQPGNFESVTATSPLSGRPYVSATSVAPTEQKALSQWAREKGIPYFDKTKATAVEEIGNANADLEGAMESVKDLFSENLGGVVGNKALAFSQWGPEGAKLKAYQKTVADYATRVMRSTAGSAGLRIQQDLLNKIIASVPDPTTDTRATAEEKIARIKTYMGNVEDSFFGGRAPTGGIDPEVERRLKALGF